MAGLGFAASKNSAKALFGAGAATLGWLADWVNCLRTIRAFNEWAIVVSAIILR